MPHLIYILHLNIARTWKYFLQLQSVMSAPYKGRLTFEVQHLMNYRVDYGTGLHASLF